MKYFASHLFKFFLIFSFCSLAYAEQNLKNTSQDLSQLLNATQSFQANFAQTIYDNRGKAIQSSQGKISFARPGRFRWQTVKPLPQLIIANEKKLWIYDPDLEQVTIRKFNSSNNDAPALLLSDTTQNINQSYIVKNIPSASIEKKYRLVPKHSEHFSAIEVAFLHGQLKEMHLTDQLGHRTVIIFSDVKTNITLPAHLFIFKIAKNLDVIDETH